MPSAVENMILLDTSWVYKSYQTDQTRPLFGGLNRFKKTRHLIGLKNVETELKGFDMGS